MSGLILFRAVWRERHSHMYVCAVHISHISSFEFPLAPDDMQGCAQVIGLQGIWPFRSEPGCRDPGRRWQWCVVLNIHSQAVELSQSAALRAGRESCLPLAVLELAACCALTSPPSFLICQRVHADRIAKHFVVFLLLNPECGKSSTGVL